MKDFKKLIDDAIRARTAIYQEIAPLNLRIKGLTEMITQLKEEESVALDVNAMSREDQIKYFLFEDGQVSGTRYNRRREFWATSSLSTNGYVPEIEQIQLRIVMYRDEPDTLERTIHELDEMLPHIKDLNGLKIVSIFENSLSENGRYDMVYDGADYLIRNTYGRHTKIVMKSTNLADVVKYIQDNLWYDTKH